MSLIQSLPAGPLDIVGDIHGEHDALQNLLAHLGYDDQGRHPEGRSLVFVGDFCDRGPDSPAVIARVQQLVESGRAWAVLGNHEINLLREDAKDGSGWFFDERQHRDQEKYAPFRRSEAGQRSAIRQFLSGLPIGLERADLRVVHAAWQHREIEVARTLPLGSVRTAYDRWESLAKEQAIASGLGHRMAQERLVWPHGLESRGHEPAFLHAHAENDVAKQMFNPLKVLTSGVARIGTAPFFSSGKWRFVERVTWWDGYADPTPVVVGHYWRRLHKIDRSVVGKGDPDLFESIHPFDWHGQRGNVFCVDFSVGGRWTERKSGQTGGHAFKLAALRWPERMLQFDDGQVQSTHGFIAPDA